LIVSSSRKKIEITQMFLTQKRARVRLKAQVDKKMRVIIYKRLSELAVQVVEIVNTM